VGQGIDHEHERRRKVEVMIQRVEECWTSELGESSERYNLYSYVQGKVKSQVPWMSYSIKIRGSHADDVFNLFSAIILSAPLVSKGRSN
jgi:hypothetical protein